MYNIKIGKFEGPLDLLLGLIEEQELDITQVSLAEVTEQYLGYLDQIEKRHPEELADFLVVASKLIYIKSKNLIPSLEIDEDAQELEYQLKIYKEYLTAAQDIEKMISKKRFVFSREKAIIIEPTFSPPPKLTKDILARAFAAILGRIEPIIELPKRAIVRAMSIKEKISQLRDRILAQATLSFQEFTKGAKGKTDIIVSFLAVLELVKQKIIDVKQPEIFQDITIERINNS
ncbi:MAG: ScpA family protein [Patescibacteria group bacterium]|nr:ScpA family protein [Patescibacteria group bacterium]MDD5490220.1 ScpA family protein [Patescibacteria group bacterium]